MTTQYIDGVNYQLDTGYPFEVWVPVVEPDDPNEIVNLVVGNSASAPITRLSNGIAIRNRTGGAAIHSRGGGPAIR